MHKSTRGQGHCLTCVKGNSDLYSNFSCKPLGPVEAKFHVELLWVKRTKVCSNGPSHVTKMAANCPYVVQAFKKSSSPKPEG